MADEQKTTEPGFFRKIYASLQRAQVSIVEEIGGDEAARLTVASLIIRNFNEDL